MVCVCVWECVCVCVGVCVRERETDGDLQCLRKTEDALSRPITELQHLEERKKERKKEKKERSHFLFVEYL